MKLPTDVKRLWWRELKETSSEMEVERFRGVVDTSTGQRTEKHYTERCKEPTFPAFVEGDLCTSGRRQGRRGRD